MYKKDECLTFHNSPHSPHTIIPNLIKPGKTVLDVGCNVGMLAKQLTDNKVDGIDINDEALKVAQKYCRHIFKRDLYANELHLPKTKYDYIVFADILEHLPRPDLILGDAVNYLDKKGKIIISLPNIARFELRIKHLFGDFTYAPGIMGYDHLRFYTKKTATALIEETGLKVEKYIPTGLGHMIPILPTLTAFQFIYVCHLK